MHPYNDRPDRSRKQAWGPTSWLSAALLAAVVAAGSFVPDARAQDEIPFDEAEVFFELNNTDGDLGIHALIDGEAWDTLTIEDPDENKVLNTTIGGSLGEQGLTEFFFESAEPTFDVLSPREFFRRFPEGTYEIEATTLEGGELESTAELTHWMPAPPDNIEVSGTAIVPDDVDCDEGPVPIVMGDVTIVWDPVTRSHQGRGFPRPIMDVEIHNYQVVVEVETASGEEVELSVTLPSDTTSLPVPAEFTDLDADRQIKFEILAREESFNQTAVESCFIVM